MDKAKEWAKKITFLRGAYERYNHCLTEDQLILAMYRDKDKSFYELNNIPDPSKKEQVKEVDILKEDYNILNYKYAECIKVNTGLKEVNKILVDALLKIDAIAYRFYGWKVADDLAEIAKTSLKEANLIK